MIPHLTRREKEVLALIGTGLSSQAAADQLFVSVRTISYHLQSVYTKLGVHNRTAAFAMATRQGQFEAVSG